MMQGYCLPATFAREGECLADVSWREFGCHALWPVLALLNPWAYTDAVLREGDLVVLPGRVR